MTTQFVDLSHHNATVDLAAYAEAGHDRVVLKATEGSTFTDPEFAGRWREAGRAGLRRGAYHFARTIQAASGWDQAGRLAESVHAAGGLLRGDFLILDLEDTSVPAAMPAAAEFVREFVAQMVMLGHAEGIIYSGSWYLNPAHITPDDVTPGWRHLWLSDYSPARDESIVLPAEWSRDQVVARQYTNRATVPGITGPVDASRVLHDWEAPVPLTRQDLDAVHKTVRAALEEACTYPGSGPLVRLGRSEGWGAHLDAPALAAALAAELPAVTADQIAAALAKVRLTTTTTVSTGATS